MSDTHCYQCDSIITLRTDINKVRLLPSGAVVCDKCYWQSKGKKKGRGFNFGNKREENSK